MRGVLFFCNEQLCPRFIVDSLLTVGYPSDIKVVLIFFNLQGIYNVFSVA